MAFLRLRNLTHICQTGLSVLDTFNSKLHLKCRSHWRLIFAFHRKSQWLSLKGYFSSTLYKRVFDWPTCLKKLQTGQFLCLDQTEAGPRAWELASWPTLFKAKGKRPSGSEESFHRTDEKVGQKIGSRWTYALEEPRALQRSQKPGKTVWSLQVLVTEKKPNNNNNNKTPQKTAKGS